MKVKAGIVTGDVTELKITERVEKGSGVISPAKLTAKVVLKNSSSNQTVRLVAGKIQYIDAGGQPIKLEETRTEPTLKFQTYGTDRLDPGQEATRDPTLVRDLYHDEGESGNSTVLSGRVESCCTAWRTAA